MIKYLSAYVCPRSPLRHRPDGTLHEIASHLTNGSIDDVSMMVSEIEDDGKRVPVLIKHCLKLNGQFIAFTVDRNFNDAVDGFVVIDLLQTDKKVLNRFMGREGSRFYAHRWQERKSISAKGNALRYKGVVASHYVSIIKHMNKNRSSPTYDVDLLCRKTSALLATNPLR